MLEVDADVSSRRDTPESTSQLLVVHPDLNVFAVQELVQPTGVVEMQVSDDDLLDILHLVAGSFDGSSELVLRLISDSREDVTDHRSPYFGVVLPAARLPEDEAFMRVLDQDAVPGTTRSVDADTTSQ